MAGDTTCEGALKGPWCRPTGGLLRGCRLIHGDYDPVTRSIPSRSAGRLLAAAAMLPTAGAAQAPTPQDLSRISPSGSYLAARHAGMQRDAGAASAYYRAALKADPKNGELLERAFLSILVDGEIDEAVKLAERLV